MTKSNKKNNDNNEIASPELIIGLVGALGTDLKKVIQHIDQSLHNLDYTTHHIKLSKLMSSFEVVKGLDKVEDLQADERIERLMDAGNSFRESWPEEQGWAVAKLAVSEFANIRGKYWGEKGEKGNDVFLRPIPKTAFVIDSLKHPDEASFFKKIYGDAFILISVYEPKDLRKKQLIQRIEKSKYGLSRVLKKEEENWLEERAAFLINKDEKENKKYGQSVSDVFYKADLFVSHLYKKEIGLGIAEQIERFFKLLFGAPFITPTVDEYGMFMAHSAALKSADLSRQVGAVILTNKAEIIATGCNEVPSIGGDPYWENENTKRPDTRDYKVGSDASAQMKHNMITEIMSELKENGWLNNKYKKQDAEKLCELALYGDKKNEKGFLKSTRVANIIEFGRIVHAEMAAITDAARRGVSVAGNILYCTTFPCHMCARHILASGLNKVIFIEPYAKSMAVKLYKGLMKVDEDENAYDDALEFQPFIGISPNRFFYLFSMENKRIERKDKKSGSAREEDTTLEFPLLENWSPYTNFQEKSILDNLEKFFK